MQQKTHFLRTLRRLIRRTDVYEATIVLQGEGWRVVDKAMSRCR